MGKIIESKLAIAELWELGIEHLERPRDRRVFCPSIKWVEQFSTWVRENKKPYMKEKFDCDDFAIWAINAAAEALFQNDEVKDCGHAVGFCEIDLTQGSLLGISGVDHANNLIRIDDGRWMFFEPQNGFYEEYTGPTNYYPAPTRFWL